MNWDVGAAIGEMIEAVAVVVSVAYLAIQIRKQTEQSRLAATREIATQYSGILNRIIEDEKFSSIYLRGVQDYASLQNEERIRVALLFQRMMTLMEQQYLHIANGHIDPKFFDSANRTFFEWLTFPGTQAWWEGSKEFF